MNKKLKFGVLYARLSENLLLIHRLWKQKHNPNSVANLLNEKNVAPRSARNWNRNSVILIIDRFKQNLITIKGATWIVTIVIGYPGVGKIDTLQRWIWTAQA